MELFSCWLTLEFLNSLRAFFVFWRLVQSHFTFLSYTAEFFDGFDGAFTALLSVLLRRLVSLASSLVDLSSWIVWKWKKEDMLESWVKVFAEWNWNVEQREFLVVSTTIFARAWSFHSNWLRLWCWMLMISVGIFHNFSLSSALLLNFRIFCELKYFEFCFDLTPLTRSLLSSSRELLALSDEWGKWPEMRWKTFLFSR